MNSILRRATRRDEGFTLVEVMVALGILMFVALAMLPLMIMSIRAGETAKRDTQAKNLLQERVELMRNLPYHVPFSTGAQYVDLLDIYFHDLNTSSVNNKCDSASYSSASKEYTCTLTTKLNFAGFTETIKTRFLDKDGNVVGPATGYDSQSATGLDLPPSQLVSVAITVGWNLYGKAKSFTTTTQMGNAAATAPQTVAKLRTSAVSVKSTADDDTPPMLAALDVGLVTADAGVSTGATARGTATGAYASLSSGATSTNQASGSVDAPPDQPTFTTQTGPASGGVPCTTVIACFGPTSVSNVTGTAAGGVPQVGSLANPLTANLVKSGSAGDRGYWFSNVPVGSVQNTLYKLRVQTLVPPTLVSPTQLVRSVQGTGNSGTAVTCTGSTGISTADFATSTGYVSTIGGSAHSVTVCGTSTARRIDIMPTTFAPEGVVQITLNSASLLCSSTGVASGAPVAKWSATVRYWSYALNTYAAPLTISDATANPLTASLLTRGPGGVDVARDPSGNVLYLGDYISSWTSGVKSGGATSGTARQTDLTAVALSTQPTRDTDPGSQSSINVSVGQISCLAQDNR